METHVAVIEQQLVSLNEKMTNMDARHGERLEKIDRKLSDEYVTQDQLDPIKRVVYGMVALVLTSFLAAVVALVLRT